MRRLHVYFVLFVLSILLGVNTVTYAQDATAAPPVVYDGLTFPTLPYPSRWVEVNGVKMHYIEGGNGGADPRFESRLKDLSLRNGWFAPASEILDYLREQPGWNSDLSFREEVRLEILFLWNAIIRGVLPAPSFPSRPTV